MNRSGNHKKTPDPLGLMHLNDPLKHRSRKKNQFSA